MNDPDGLDPHLQQLYRKLAHAEPDAALDEKILQAARHHTLKARRWQQPFALVASMVLVGSLVLYWRAEQPLQLEQAVSVVKEPSAAVPALPTPPTLTEPSTKPRLSAKEQPIAQAKASSKVLSIEQSPLAGGIYPQAVGGGIARHDTQLKDKKETTSNMPAKVTSTAQQPHDDVEEGMIAASTPPAPAVGSVQPDSTVDKADKADKTDKTEESSAATELPTANRISSDSRLQKQALSAPRKPAVAAEQTQPLLGHPTPQFNATIDGVSLGMNVEQLQHLGFGCANDVCRKHLTQPHQASYWGIPSLNAQLKVFVSQGKASKLVLEQTPVEIAQVHAVIAQWGQATDKVCVEEKGLFVSQRLVEGIVVLLRQQGKGAEVTLCRAP